jgi:NADH-quinone oxidoreductase subunit E
MKLGVRWEVISVDLAPEQAASPLVAEKSEKLDALVDSYAGREEQLISLLQDIQAEFNYLPQGALVKVSQRLDIPLSRVFGVATFFSAFTLAARGRHMITVCQGTACHVRAGQRLVDVLEQKYGLRPGETTADSRFTLDTVYCLGCCTTGPIMVIDGKYESSMTPEKLDRVLGQYK